MKDKYHEIQDEYRGRYSDITDDDVNVQPGRFDRTSDRIGRRRGKSPAEVQDEIENWLSLNTKLKLDRHPNRDGSFVYIMGHTSYETIRNARKGATELKIGETAQDGIYMMGLVLNINGVGIIGS